MAHEVVNLKTAPQIISDIEQALEIPQQSLSDLESALLEERERYQKFLETDPTKTHGVSPGLDKIRAWVRERDSLKVTLEEQVLLCDQERKELHVEIDALQDRLEGVREIVSERESKLKELLACKERDRRFSEALLHADVFKEFIEYHSSLLLEMLDTGNIGLTGCDTLDREMYREATARGKTYNMRFGYASWRLSSVKTLTALYGQLAKELGFKPRQSFYDGFCGLLKKSGMKRILEIGPGDRGIVNLLSESGIADECKLELFAIDPYVSAHKKTEYKNSGISLVQEDALQAKKFFSKASMDIVLAVGVFSFGGLGTVVGKESILEKYRATAGKAHKLLKVVHEVMSEHPNACCAIGSVHGVHALFKEQLCLNTAYWQEGVRDAYDIERSRIQDHSPIGGLGVQHTTAQGHAWRNWVELNKKGLDFTDKLIEQSSDLAILKK